MVFKGWSKTPNGSVISNLINLCEVQGDEITLYAIWGPKIENTVDFAGGDGSTYFPYRISTGNHFQYVDKYPSANYVLVSNITLNDQMVAGTFNGVFDGQGYTISGAISISSSESSSHNIWAGPISYNTGTIKNVVSTVNVTLRNTCSTADITYAVGGIVGNNEGTVENCTVHDATLNIYHQRWMDDHKNSFTVIGGVAGQSSGIVTACLSYNNTIYAYNDSTKGSWGYYYSYAGGVVGQINGGTIEHSVSYNNSVTANAKAGGDPGVFEYTYIHAYAGGFVGKSVSGTINNCYAGGNSVNASSSKYVSTGYGKNVKSGTGLFSGDKEGATINSVYGKKDESGSVTSTGTLSFSATYSDLSDVVQKLNTTIGSETFTLVDGYINVRMI